MHSDKRLGKAHLGWRALLRQVNTASSALALVSPHIAILAHGTERRHIGVWDLRCSLDRTPAMPSLAPALEVPRGSVGDSASAPEKPAHAELRNGRQWPIRKKLATILGTAHEARVVSLSAKGGVVASGDQAGQVCLWSLPHPFT